MVQVCNESWDTEGTTPRTAAVCSYGFGGANAHVIVSEVSKSLVSVTPERRIVNRIMTLSAPSKNALRSFWPEKYPNHWKQKRMTTTF